MEKESFDVIVIGAGVGGYVAAIRAAQKGVKVALIENREMGGTCLNRGCIPSKSLIADSDALRRVKNSIQHGISCENITFDYEKMAARKDRVVERLRKGVTGLIASNKISFFQGFGKFFSPTEVKVLGEKEVILEGKNIIIATGSEPRELPQFPVDKKIIHDSTAFLNLTRLPEKLVIIGGGIIGCEFASLHRSLGVDVTIIELLPLIISTEGKSVSEVLTTALKRQGIKIELNAIVTSMEKTDKGVIFNMQDGKKIEADMVLVSVGRKYNTDNIGLEKTGVIVEKNGFIPVNDKMETNIPHIYAIGDITQKWLLAHVASHQGMVAADNATGHLSKMSYKAVPSVTFTHPEIATVGLTLEKALEEGYDAVTGKFPFQALGKSQAAIETDGFAQVVISKSTKQILGAQVVGHEAGTLIAEMTVAIQNELTIESITETIHAHPTISEAWLEAALLAIDEPIHFPPKPK